ncbi:MAG: MBL fold metallo-hydrolase, partial [Pseudomonadota bacterium]
MTSVNPTFLKAGYCTHPEAITLKGGRWNNIQFPDLFVLIQHPTVGNILYDTGYSESFFQATKSFPNRFYALLTPVYLQPEETAIQQLEQRGISADSI